MMVVAAAVAVVAVGAVATMMMMILLPLLLYSASVAVLCTQNEHKEQLYIKNKSNDKLIYICRPRCSSGYRAYLWIRGSWVRSRPGSMDFFKA